MDCEGFRSDFFHGHGGDFAPVELVDAELDFTLELLDFDSGEGIVVFLRGEDEGGATMFRDGNRTRASAVQDLAELLLCGVCGDGFHRFRFIQNG